MATRSPAARPASRPSTTRKAPAPAAAPVAAAKPAPVAAPAPKAPKAEKAPKKPKLVRDSFTMPEADFALIAQLKARALGVQREARKSELLRAGLQALAALDAKALKAALDALAPVKVGRPKNGR